MKTFTIFRCCLILVASYSPAFAQFNLDGQLVQRAEMRNGYNRLIQEDADPAVFIAQRARLQASYKLDNFNFYMSIQDVRTWGNTSQIKASDDFLSVHEAWAEVGLGEFWKIKLGRQELNYDNFRFLGNLDWALQARAHDFALAKYEKEDLKLHFGGGYNQDGQALSGTDFTVPNQYKAAQMLRYENKFNRLQLSVLVWNEGRQFIRRDSLGAITNKKTPNRQTLGIPTLKYPIGNTTLSAFYYHQLGRDQLNRKVNAYDLGLQITHLISLDAEKGRQITLAAGAEVLSGTEAGVTDENNSFSPLYGTNHLHNGYMDLFYVGGAHENSVGLQDYYLKSRYAFNNKLFVQADVHTFFAIASVPNPSSPDTNNHLGAEIDLSLGFQAFEAMSVQAGYSQFFKTDTFEQVQGNGTLKDNQNWAYLMLIFRPTMKNKFIGILL